MHYTMFAPMNILLCDLYPYIAMNVNNNNNNNNNKLVPVGWHRSGMGDRRLLPATRACRISVTASDDRSIRYGPVDEGCSPRKNVHRLSRETRVVGVSIHQALMNNFEHVGRRKSFEKELKRE